MVDRRTGEVRAAHLFAVLGGSSPPFARATWSEQVPDWIEGYHAAFALFSNATQLLVPDNARVAVIKACHFDPMINRSHTDMARHYGTAVLASGATEEAARQGEGGGLCRHCRALAFGAVA